jgi:predicted nuclease of restriction endonuclease-like (RecB) superfamily
MTGQLGPPLSRSFTLSWTHYVFLLGVKNPDERSFYEIEAGEQNWTVRELKRQFDSGLYERLALSRDKEGIRRLAREGQTVGQARDLLKEPLVLEFLGLDERSRYSESDLESAIIGQIERFLLEMGKGFLFEARQRRFTFDEDHFFVDLVFYNAPSQVITTWASRSCMRALRASAEKPPNTTLWVMPSRAQASRATGSSGTMPM